MEYWGPSVFVNRKTKEYKERRVTRAQDYRKLYRFTEENVQWITDHFLGQNWNPKGGSLTPKQKIQVFLRYMADPGFQSGIAEDIGVEQATVSYTVQEVMNKILAKLKDWIKFPSTPAEVLIAKQEWMTKYKMPFAIGTVDCTHIKIPKPKHNGDEYLNRKKYFSINVQATCDSKERFTSVVAAWPGSVHDSRIFRNSGLMEILSKLPDTILLADSGYFITPYLITPFSNPVTPAEYHFNSVYAKERVTVERCFGQLKKRFPILHYKVRTKLANVGGIISACFVLHNVAKFLNDSDDDFPELADDDPEEGPSPDEVSETRTRQLGQRKRNEIAQLLYTTR